MGDTDDIGSNLSGNPHLGDMILERVNRRQVIGGSLAAAAVGIFGRSIFAATPASAAAAAPAGITGGMIRQNPQLLGFTPVGVSTDDTVHVPEGYRVDTLIPWGTPLFDDSPAWMPDASNTAADQAMQVGFNHDGIHFFPFGNGSAGSGHGLLVLNHEYTDANQIYTADARAQRSPTTLPAGRRSRRRSQGMASPSSKSSGQEDGSWQHVQGSPFNRRITGTTPMEFSGPVPASHPMLQSELGNAPTGTLNNCGHGYTPWGTYLAAEENWNGYFGTDDTTWVRECPRGALRRERSRLRIQLAQGRGAFRPGQEPQ